MAPASTTRRSDCPISSALEVVGDRWTLLLIRDLIFGGARTFKDFLASREGIATNILSDRLGRLVDLGVMNSERDPADGRVIVYRLTPKGMDLVPVLMELSVWGARHENGQAPEGVLEAWQSDRDGFLRWARSRQDRT